MDLEKAFEIGAELNKIQIKNKIEKKKKRKKALHEKY